MFLIQFPFAIRASEIKWLRKKLENLHLNLKCLASVLLFASDLHRGLIVSLLLTNWNSFIRIIQKHHFLTVLLMVPETGSGTWITVTLLTSLPFCTFSRISKQSIHRFAFTSLHFVLCTHCRDHSWWGLSWQRPRWKWLCKSGILWNPRSSTEKRIIEKRKLQRSTSWWHIMLNRHWEQKLWAQGRSLGTRCCGSNGSKHT